MCNPALIGLAIMAAGTGATYLGQRQGAKAAQSVANAEENYQKSLRKKSLQAASDTIDKTAGAKPLLDAMAAPQAAITTGQGNAATIAQAALDAGGPTDASGVIYNGAVSDAERAGRPLATRTGFSNGLEDQDTALARLVQGNLFLGEDSRRSASTLGRRIARAGRKGSGLRLAGQGLNMVGGAMTGGALWGPAAAASTEATTGALTRMQASRQGSMADR